MRRRPTSLGAALVHHGLPPGAALGGTPRLGDAEFIRFLRRYQLRALRTGKREAAEWAFRERARDLARTGIPDAARGADLTA